jgi:peptide/nickel transport system ATP-binding protein
MPEAIGVNMDLLEIEDLKMYYKTSRGLVHAVENVSFGLEKGRAVGLAGESGCGKTSVGLSILRLLPDNAKVMSGKILLDGESLLEMELDRFRKDVRWAKISMIFQGAMNALHPIFKIGDQIAESIMIHDKVKKEEAFDRAGKLLNMVGVKSERIDRYPHELSGGMKQRVVIAMALACNPQVVIADEPTTALDVIVQGQVLKVIRELQEKLGLSMIEISHDLSLISETCHYVAIMYAGKIVEYGDIVAVFKRPTHPYTIKLLGAFPSLEGPKREISTIGGFPPDLLQPPPGCRFHPRCAQAKEECRRSTPNLVEVESQHFVACHVK